MKMSNLKAKQIRLRLLRHYVPRNDLFIIKWSSDHHVASLLVMTLVVVLHYECTVTKQMQ
jgi:hypothetical protein